ncbi:hypothetical protein Ancab_005756 [Ancistrocladus abbreviatus]
MPPEDSCELQKIVSKVLHSLFASPGTVRNFGGMGVSLLAKSVGHFLSCGCCCCRSRDTCILGVGLTHQNLGTCQTFCLSGLHLGLLGYGHGVHNFCFDF